MASLPPIISVCSKSWNRNSSYGRYALETADQLRQRGVVVNTIGANAPDRNFRLSFSNLLLGYPTGYADFGDICNIGLKIALTMWESTVIPEGWAEVLNTCARVLVPCQWNKQVFQNCGVTEPIEVVPLGISSAFRYAEREAESEKRPFRFLTIADRGDRKGYISAMNAFYRAFGDRMDVELVIKARTKTLFPLSNPNIREIFDEYSDEEMAALYASCDVLLWGGKGEGFALPPREFAATGGISLSTNFGGMADEIVQWGIPIDYHMVPAWTMHRKFKDQQLGEWAEIDEDGLVAMMQIVRAMPLEARQYAGKVYSENVGRLYGWNRFGERLTQIIAEAIDDVQIIGESVTFTEALNGNRQPA